MKNFTPRHLRKRYNNKSGAGDKDKQRAFKRAAAWSKRFINQPASYLEKPSVAPHYAVWCNRSREGKGLR
jgi:hypothetical protein